ncbi:MAG: type VI secretion system baseplate subunit TssE [Gemmobacter sp.]|jgi:type VI secretion system protein ImpF|nr:type VI secretion system baseplate subunit TssE [Gemmobacter sp.]
MSDRTIVDRLQPSLLDRLVDQAPDRTVDGPDDRLIDLRRLREIIRRDLGWLLNSTNNEREIDPEVYPHAARSVLNFGVEEVAGDYNTLDRALRIRASIRKAVERFEPRLSQGTLDVVLRQDEKLSQAVVVFDIHADMWAQPVPMELYLRSRIDLTTGQVALERVG